MCYCRSGGEGTRWRDGATWWSQAAVGVTGGAKWSRGASGVAGRAKWSQLAVEAARGRSRGAGGGRRAEQRRSMVRASRGTAGGRRAEQRRRRAQQRSSAAGAGGGGAGVRPVATETPPVGTAVAVSAAKDRRRRVDDAGDREARMMPHVNHCYSAPPHSLLDNL